MPDTSCGASGPTYQCNSAMTIGDEDSAWVIADERYFNRLAVQELADIVICGDNSDQETEASSDVPARTTQPNHSTCNHQVPSQWVCSSCATANWEAKTYCRRCWRQRSRTAWTYPARAAPPAAKVTSEKGRPCVDCGLHTVSSCADCMAPDRAHGGRWKKGYSVPLCSRCHHKWWCCHHCRGVAACTPMPHGHADYDIRPDGMPNELFTPAGAMGR